MKELASAIDDMQMVRMNFSGSVADYDPLYYRNHSDTYLLAERDPHFYLGILRNSGLSASFIY
jgi:hypothetical protein